MIELLHHQGSDNTIANTARVSMELSGGWDELPDNYSEEQRDKLINYLATHKHTSPFRHNSISIRCNVPIFLARQLGKHQIGMSWNEVSRRYVDTDVEFYTPSEWRTKPEGSIKQGSGTERLPKPDFEEGFCAQCGTALVVGIRNQGGGQRKKYCSTSCKAAFTNKHRNPYKTKFQNAKARVNREGKREWSLDFDTFEFPDYCKYLGIKLDYSSGRGEICDNSPSFDRINPDLDYVKGNVEIISNKANSMKNNASVEEQVKMAEAVLLRHKGYIPNYEHSYEGLLNKALKLYTDMLDAGYAAEQARMVLPQSMMTQFIWTGSLMAFAHVYNLRIDGHAQAEAQEFAKELDEIIRPLFPVAWKALTK